MNLLLDRRSRGVTPTLGDLYVDGVFECYTLEDMVRSGSKVPGDTAIPAGTYDIDITWSPHFGRPLPLLLNVPDFEGVRIHPGNTAADTEGCILVGEEIVGNALTGSRVAFNRLFDAMLQAKSRGERIDITIEDTSHD